MAGRDVPGLLHPSASALLVVDVQEAFRPVMTAFDAMAGRCAALVRTFGLLDLPVVVTEQYPKGLGGTVEVVREALPAGAVPDKTAFSSLACGQVRGLLEASGTRSVVVCGIEAHVCVSQTVHELLAENYRVHVAVDAVLSRHAQDRDVALRRMESAGAVLTTAEAAAFELLRDARHPRFKAIQALFKA